MFFVSGNVMWLDDISAARALLGLSVKIKNLIRNESKGRRNVDNDSVEDATMDEEEDESDKNSENCDNDEVNMILNLNISFYFGYFLKVVIYNIFFQKVVF